MEKCPQCTATTKIGDRCRRTTCRYAPYCASHKAYRVAQSNIPNAGRGTFAVCDLKKGSTIGSYIIATKRRNKAEFLESHPIGRATHTALVKGGYFTATGAAGNRTHNAIGMLNTAPRGERNNARLLASGRVVTSRGVKKDAELLLAYFSFYKI